MYKVQVQTKCIVFQFDPYLQNSNEGEGGQKSYVMLILVDRDDVAGQQARHTLLKVMRV